MGGGSDDGGGYNPAMFNQASPMPGVPVSSAGGSGGTDPYNYGKYQSFLPVAGSAHGLTDDMFKYRTPNEIMNPGAADTTPPPAAPAAPEKANPFAGGRYLYNPATGAQVGGFASPRDYLADMMAQRKARLYGQQQPAPSTPPPAPAPPTPVATPDWMSASMTG
jgi:hypothetical protein